MQPINKNLHMGMIFAGPALGFVLMIIGIVLMIIGGNSNSAALSLVASGAFCFAMIPFLCSVVFLAITIYKLWDSIQDGTARTTPGKACGFIFIPFFCLYWYFVAFLGWSQDYNNYIRERNVQAPEVSEKLTMVACILFVCGIIPYLGILTWLAGLACLFPVYSKSIDGANIIRAQREPVPAGGDTLN